MENFIQILYQRVELIDESQTAIETLQRMLNRLNWMYLKKTLHRMKKHEQIIQSLENECLLLMQMKNNYSKSERKKFHKITAYSIQKFVPQYISHFGVINGSHKNLCIMFINFYIYLQMPEKVIEIQTIYESKLYKTVPFLFLLAKWYVVTYRKLNTTRFKQFDHQLHIYDEQLNKDPQNNQIIISNQTSRRFRLKEYENNSNQSDIIQRSEIDIQMSEKKKKFRIFNKLIRQVMPDAEYEEIPTDLYTATIKYRSLLLRNLEIQNSIDEYLLCQQHSQIKPEQKQLNSQSFNFSQNFISNRVKIIQSSKSLRQDNKERAESVKLHENKRAKSKILPQLADQHQSTDEQKQLSLNSIEVNFCNTINTRKQSKKQSGQVSKSPSALKSYFTEKSATVGFESQKDLYTIYEKKSRTDREKFDKWKTKFKQSVIEKKSKKSEKIDHTNIAESQSKIKCKKIIFSIQ